MIDCVEVQSLDEGWTLRNTNGSIVVSHVTVPTETHTALHRAGVIGDPTFRMNDVAQRWVATEPVWTFSTSFLADTAVLKSPDVLLVIESLDTVATVELNGHVVLESANQFHRHKVPVGSVLSSGTNNLTIAFHSPVTYAAAGAAAYPYSVPHATFLNGFDNANFVRKRPSDFGWDWGPAFATSGLSSVSLHGVQFPQLDTVLFHTAFDDTAAVSPDLGSSMLSVSAQAVVSVSEHCQQTGPVTVRFSFPELPGVVLPPVTASTTSAIDGELVMNSSVTVPVSDVELWWPAGYGDQRLYVLNVTLSVGQDTTTTTTPPSSSSSSVVSSWSSSVGFRDSQLVQEPYSDQEGLSFYFKVNGVPVWAKGASYVPSTPFLSTESAVQQERLVQSLVAANGNMVRIWGGQDYRPNKFYSLLDKYGVLAWIDFMFASALYPRDGPTVASVQREVTDQVRLLSRHPSIVVWTGNNEGVIDTNRSASDPTMQVTFVADYTVLFDQGLRMAMYAAAPFATFYASCPSNGMVMDDPAAGLLIHRWGYAFDPRYGDVRHYDYTSNCLDVSKYPQGRFVSEFGWQSLPSLDTLKPSTVPSDWSLQSDVMKARQHHPNGNTQLLEQIARVFHLPATTNATANFEQLIYLTQVVQTRCIEHQIVYYRSLRTQPANTMGALYWQLNDVWAAPSWSSTESGPFPRWKMLHYGAARGFRPVGLSGWITTPDNPSNMTLVVLNDGGAALDAGEFKIVVWLWTGVVHTTKVVSVPSVAGRSTSDRFTVDLPDLLNTHTVDDVVIDVEYVAGSGDGPSASVVLYPAPLTNVSLPAAHVHIVSVDVSSDGASATVVLQSDALAPWTWISTSEPGHWSDNGMLLLPSRNSTLTFTAWSTLSSPAAFRSKLSVMTLSDTLS